jgi:hypothetical protein
MRRAWLVLSGALGGGLIAAVPAPAVAEDAPDLAFLEYLGSWEESDDEWELVAEWDEDSDAEQEDQDDARREGQADARPDARPDEGDARPDTQRDDDE